MGPARPRITGISHASFFTSDAAKAKKFYGDLLGLAPGAWAGVYVVGSQSIEAEAKAPPNDPRNKVPSQLSHVAFATDDAEALRAYLAAHGIEVPAEIHKEKSGTHWFAMNDPEGNPIEFVQESAPAVRNPNAISRMVIHAGFVVRDRSKADKFYRDLLGFKLYWHGGMTDARTDWVDMQVPDGAEWLEYMMVAKDAQLDRRTLGILDHVALGVSDIKVAQKTLEGRGWKPSKDEQAQIGKDGKWQLNLYDPDGTRVELMEFAPVKEPCCSKYVGPHPH